MSISDAQLRAWLDDIPDRPLESVPHPSVAFPSTATGRRRWDYSRGRPGSRRGVVRTTEEWSDRPSASSFSAPPPRRSRQRLPSRTLDDERRAVLRAHFRRFKWTGSSSLSGGGRAWNFELWDAPSRSWKQASVIKSPGFTQAAVFVGGRFVAKIKIKLF